jgi:hypothetical protein
MALERELPKASARTCLWKKEEEREDWTVLINITVFMASGLLRSLTLPAVETKRLVYFSNGPGLVELHFPT